MAARHITVWYLEMNDPAQLRPKRISRGDLAVRQAEIPLPELNRFLYTAVGADWYWTMRVQWDYAQWLNWLERPGVQTWVAYIRGTPAGYFELDGQTGGDVEIAYFGILPRFIGQGLGGHLLTEAIEQAWRNTRTKRVWLHTCSLDHPAALANYQARGLRIYRTETLTETLPDQPLGPWPGRID